MAAKDKTCCPLVEMLTPSRKLLLRSVKSVRLCMASFHTSAKQSNISTSYLGVLCIVVDRIDNLSTACMIFYYYTGIDRVSYFTS